MVRSGVESRNVFQKLTGGEGRGVERSGRERSIVEWRGEERSTAEWSGME